MGRSCLFCCLISLVLLVVLLPTAESGESRQCKFSGYKPGGFLPGITAISAVPPPKFQTNVLDDVLERFGEGAEVAQAVVEVIAHSSKKSPHVAAALGLFAVAMGLTSNKPSPQDILDRAYKSVELLTEEVNERIKQLQDYADVKDLQLEKRLMERNYRELFDKWFDCAKLRPGQDEAECQGDSEAALRNARFHFQPLQPLFDDKLWDGSQKYDPNRDKRFADWQYIARKNGNGYWAPTHGQVKQLEIGLIPFRDYATLHLIVLETLAGTYQDKNGDQACKSYKYYLNMLVEKSDYYARYAKWAFLWILARQQRENYKLANGGYHKTTKCITGKCTVECVQMIKDNVCTITGSKMWILRGRPNAVCHSYLAQLGGAVVKFWKDNLLVVSKKWEKYGENAKKKLSAMKCKYLGQIDLISLIDPFSFHVLFPIPHIIPLKMTRRFK